jgi:hypothetical protein
MVTSKRLADCPLITEGIRRLRRPQGPTNTRQRGVWARAPPALWLLPDRRRAARRCPADLSGITLAPGRGSATSVLGFGRKTAGSPAPVGPAAGRAKRGRNAMEQVKDG